MVLDANDLDRRLAQAADGSEARAHRSLPCSPWDRWVLVALHRHVDRQRFVEQIVRECLSGSPELLARAGSSGHPEGPGRGEVPGLPAWQYYFHGRGCCLRHQDGTTIDVDFDDEHGSATIDPWFYERFLESTPDPGWPERLLQTADGDWQGWKAAIQPLRAAGLLEGDHRVRVMPHAADWCEAVSQAIDLAKGSEAQLRAIALAIEDFSLAAKPGLQAAAKQQTEDRCRDLEARIAARIEPHVASCVAALHSLDAQRARATALAELQHGAIDVVLSACMRMLVASPRPGDIPAVCALLERLRGVQPPAPYLRIYAAHRLLAPYRRATVPKHVRSLVLDALAEDQRGSEGEAALLVYLLDAERGLARMRAGLRSSVPIARHRCAAALAFVEVAEFDPHTLELADWMRHWEDD